jgi:GAF domain-containing protein
MAGAPLPSNENARLEALHELRLLDTPPDRQLDQLLVDLTQRLGMPAAAVSLLDRDRQWFKSRVGLSFCATPREVAFCAHAILGEAPMVVRDATCDRRFCDNPLVVGEPGIRFFAGVPLSTPSGFALGTLCVIDYRPRELSRRGLALLTGVARTVMAHIAVRREVERAPLDHRILG